MLHNFTVSTCITAPNISQTLGTLVLQMLSHYTLMRDFTRCTGLFFPLSEIPPGGIMAQDIYPPAGISSQDNISPFGPRFPPPPGGLVPLPPSPSTLPPLWMDWWWRCGGWRVDNYHHDKTTITWAVDNRSLFICFPCSHGANRLHSCPSSGSGNSCVRRWRSSLTTHTTNIWIAESILMD